MGADKVDIWNRALSRIGGQLVADENEASMTAGYCRRFYKEAIDNMLEGPNEWSFAKQRQSLSLAATNTRPAEWLYAYNVPSNMGTPVRVIPDLSAAGTLVPIPLPGVPYAETWAAYLDELAAPYVLDEGVIYCNEPNAILEYVINDLTSVTVPAMVTKTLAVEMAGLLAGSPVKKDRALAKDLMSEADLMWQRAIADDRNRQPAQYGNFTSEALLARHGDLMGL